MTAMHLRIAERCKPFSRLPGTMLPLPHSSFLVQVFPARLRLFDASQTPCGLVQDIPLQILGPVDEFTVQEDLESGCVRVWGFGKAGFFRYRLVGVGGRFSGHVEKGEVLGLPTGAEDQPESIVVPRLSLGSHKKQDWELIVRRRDFCDVMPLWYRLGMTTPPQKPATGGTATRLLACRDAIQQGHPEHILPAFDVLFRVGFTGLLTPTLVDEVFQGVVDDNDRPTGSPLWLLTEGARMIQSLFVQQEGAGIEILPALPPEFHCGRLLEVPCQRGMLNLEWRKKVVRRMIWTSTQDDSVTFRFRRDMKTFRLRKDGGDPGVVVPCGEPIQVSKGQTLWLDRFEQ